MSTFETLAFRGSWELETVDPGLEIANEQQLSKFKKADLNGIQR